MASYCEVFERKEKKYRLSARQHQRVLAALAGHMEIDAFGKAKITSLYYDTPDRRLIARSLEKPLYKEKLRVRCYSGAGSAEGAGACAGSAASEDSDLVFIEVKKKYKGIVYKRRVGCSRAAAQAYLSGEPYERACSAHPLADDALAAESLSGRSVQISREIDQFLVRYETLGPSMTITCMRTAYTPTDAADGDLRITFDTELAYRDQFARHAAAQPLLAPGEAVMEVKNSGPMPLWLAHALAECEAYPSSFSKYGTAYSLCRRAVASQRVAKRKGTHASATASLSRSGFGRKATSSCKAHPRAGLRAPSVKQSERATTNKERVLDCA